MAAAVVCVLLAASVARPPLLADVAAGFAGGVAKTVLFFPLDTLTTLAEVDERRADGEAGAADGAAVGAPPLRRLYCGLGVSLLCALPYAMAFHTTSTLTVRPLDRLLAPRAADAATALAASAASIAATVVGVPAECLKHRSQLRLAGYESLPAALASARRAPLAHFAGYATTLYRNVPYNALHFTLYGILLRCARALVSPARARLVGPPCGALTGALVALLTQPLDMLNTRRQVATPRGLPAAGAASTPSTPAPVRSVLASAREIVSREGSLAALFRGWRPRAVLFAASGAVFFGVYSLVLEHLALTLC